MRSIVITSLLSVVMQVHIQELAANGTAWSSKGEFVEKIIDKLGHRASKTWPLHYADMNDMVLGKPGHISVPPCTSALCSFSSSPRGPLPIVNSKFIVSRSSFPIPRSGAISHARRKSVKEAPLPQTRKKSEERAKRRRTFDASRRSAFGLNVSEAIDYHKGNLGVPDLTAYWDTLQREQDHFVTAPQKAKKTLGQHFIVSDEITDRIAGPAGVEGEVVLEIGPGPGALTRSILKAGAKRIVALEKDERFVEYLQDLVNESDGRLEVLEGDAEKLKLAQVAQNRSTDKLTLVANLPFSIGTALLLNWLDEIEYVKTMTLMFQLEVAQRISAKPSTSSFCPLTIFSQYLCDVDVLFELPPEAFTPSPRITSSVIQLVPKKLTAEELALYPFVKKVVREAWTEPRKMIRNCLKQLFSEEELIQASIDVTWRPHMLNVTDFVRLARIVASRPDKVDEDEVG